MNVKKEINKRLRRVTGDNDDPNRRESFINENDQPGIPNNYPNNDKKVDDEEAKTPTDGTNDYSTADDQKTFAQRGSKMVKDSKAGFKMVKNEFKNLKKTATGYMKSSEKEP